MLPLAANADGVVGSSNVAPIEPTTVPVPNSTPCAVSLFTGTTFGGDAVAFPYAPPSACPGPWAKIVLQADISVTAGRQYDRTASILIGGVPVLFGTTAEPRSTLSPSWHVERDVTDDTALLKSTQTGRAQIQNYTDSTFTGIMTASAKLLFYPATAAFPVPTTPDLVVPLNADPTAGPSLLNSGTDALARTGVLPSTIERGRLDVYLQSQADDEFWYTCVPDALASELETCGGGAFREGMVTVDGTRAGVAPVYPWIYTGGIDPYLWEPTPGVQTLAFEPAHVELTPFAGVIDDNKSHTIAVSVTGADTSFAVTGALYLTLDHRATGPLRGALTADTLQAATPVVSNTITTSNGTTTGGVNTSVIHTYSITGTLQTSHGAVTTTVAQYGTFSNRQSFEVSSSVDDQSVVQNTDTLSTVTTVDGSGTKIAAWARSYPLKVQYDFVQAADSSYIQATSVTQGLKSGAISLVNGVPTHASALVETVAPNDTLAVNASGSLVSHTGSGTASYLFGDTATGCITRRSASTNSVLTSSSANGNCDILGVLSSFPGYSAIAALQK